MSLATAFCWLLPPHMLHHSIYPYMTDTGPEHFGSQLRPFSGTVLTLRM
jgi:hypothetical protein